MHDTADVDRLQAGVELGDEPEQVLGGRCPDTLVAASISEPPLRLVDLVLGATVFAGSWLILNVTSPASIGFRDVKYSAALGVYLAWFDPMLGLTAVALTALFAWPHSVVRIVRRDTTPTVPLGPYLLAGAAASIALSIA